jgi:hypothetical protein
MTIEAARELCWLIDCGKWAGYEEQLAAPRTDSSLLAAAFRFVGRADFDARDD